MHNKPLRLLLVLLLGLNLSALAWAGEEVERIIVFGDSLSDGGYYSFLSGGALPPGSSFTTNPDPVAPEVFASEMGLGLQPAYGEEGFNFATGGARVTASNALSIPITTQIDNFLAAGGRFDKNDLVYIQGGGNDFFAFQAGGEVDDSILTSAAQDLAQQVTRIGQAGAGRIVTLSIQSFGMPGLQLFNDTYEAALQETGVNLLYFDADALYNELLVNAGEFGYSAILDPACGAVSSVQCTPADRVSPDANETHLLADDVHPAGKTQRIQGQAIASVVMAPDQLGQLAYASQSLFRGHYDLNQQALAEGYGQPVGSSEVFLRVAEHRFDVDGMTGVPGLEEDSNLVNLGIDHRMAEDTSVGLAFALSDGDGEFDSGRGDYNVDAASVLLYAQGRAGALHLHSDFIYGRVNYENLTRTVQLGPVSRSHQGDTDGDFIGVDISAALPVSLTDSLLLQPKLGLAWQALTIDGYREDSDLSTGMSFGKQQLNSLTAQLGVSLRNAVSSRVHFYLDGQFNYELDEDHRRITVTPNGAPVSYRAGLYLADREYFSGDVGIVVGLTDSLRLQAGINGSSGRDNMDAVNSYVGAMMDF